ncbi:MAG: hypothetical protein JWM52_496 [Candidatus Saccharibacteria bacterium]|nr:hypothetical protein [Candidatus Saccharibacteria bacterium]
MCRMNTLSSLTPPTNFIKIEQTVVQKLRRQPLRVFGAVLLVIMATIIIVNYGILSLLGLLGVLAIAGDVFLVWTISRRWKIELQKDGILFLFYTNRKPYFMAYDQINKIILTKKLLAQGRYPAIRTSITFLDTESRMRNVSLMTIDDIGFTQADLLALFGAFNAADRVEIDSLNIAELSRWQPSQK